MRWNGLVFNFKATERSVWLLLPPSVYSFMHVSSYIQLERRKWLECAAIDCMHSPNMLQSALYVFYTFDKFDRVKEVR